VHRGTQSHGDTIAKDEMHFQVISDQGRPVDSGVLPRFSDQEKKKFSTATAQ
jgi:hypothetical protein